MDFLPDLSHLSEWLLQHGSVFLFLALALGIIALPVPDETLMIVAGSLIKHEKLELLPTVIAAYLGSFAGITASYVIGRVFGIFVIHKYGKLFGLTKKRLDHAHVWFEKYGKWMLTIGYFIPGIRHFTGILAGATKLSFKHFMLYAYGGALIWASSFLAAGYMFGGLAVKLFEKIEFSFDEAILAIAALLIIAAIFVIVFKKRKKKRRKR